MIRVSGLRKTYVSKGRRQEAVRGISFDHPSGEFLTLLGPSGCGKSTTLRCIAGLETPDEGEIHIGERLVYSALKRVNLSPARRRIGMVFQSYAIWPHMSVYKNVEYPLRFTGVPSQERRERVDRVLNTVGLGHLADRPAPDLSGGQQQRVALARALVGEPDVLLLDEPLSNLDARLRRELGQYLRDLQQRLRLTVLYVTHDQSEAMSMSDTVALMREGQIIESGHPELMYRNPRSHFTARFLGIGNFLEVGALRREGDGWIAETPHGEFGVSPRSAANLEVDGSRSGQRLLLMIRPEEMTIGAWKDQRGDRGAERNEFQGEIQSMTFYGFVREYRIRTATGLVLRVRNVERESFELGETTHLSVPLESCILVEDTTGGDVGVSEELMEVSGTEAKWDPERKAEIPAVQLERGESIR